MRILHVNKFLYRRGGAESYMLDVAAEQRAAGHHVGFFSMEHPDNDEDPNADLFPSRMELNPPPDGAAARARTAAQVLWRRDARKAMERVLDRERPGVVHLHNVYHQLSPSILRPLAQRGVPAVMTLHDYKLVCPTYQFLDADGQICEACLPAAPGGRPRFEEATKRRCNGGSLAGSGLATLELTLHRSTDAYGPVRTFLCPSAFLRDKVAAGGMHPDRLAHLPNFCDVSGVVPATEPGAGVLFAGRLSHEKGVDTLVDAAALLPADVTVTIAGDGPERERLEKRAADRGLAAKVQFLGRVPMAELHDRMRAAAVVAVPSRWYENQPMSVLEACGCGRPVVASDLGGLPEMVEDGVTGHLVPHDDPTALAEALGRLAGDPAAAHAMGDAARRRAVTTYSIDAHVAALEDHYRRVRT